MTERLCLILGCDQHKDELGPRTIRRLEVGLRHARENGERIVVAATVDPEHPDLPPLGELMSQWLTEQGYWNTLVLRAPTFNTRGEVVAVRDQTDGELLSVVSGRKHLERTWYIVRNLYDTRTAYLVRWVPVPERVTLKDQVLEPFKVLFVRFVPDARQEGWWKRISSGFRIIGIRLSY